MENKIEEKAEAYATSKKEPGCMDWHLIKDGYVKGAQQKQQEFIKLIEDRRDLLKGIDGYEARVQQNEVELILYLINKLSKAKAL